MKIWDAIELLKIAGWTFVILYAILNHQKMNVNSFWLTVISGICMVFGSIDDLGEDWLIDKSLWWVAGNFMVIITIIYLINKCSRCEYKFKKKVDKMADKIKKNHEKYGYK